MSSDEIILSIRNIWKTFAIYEKPADRLKQMLLGRFGKKYFSEFHALKGVSFDVKKGECVGIIGRNGAGKSTLLQIITGTLQPTGGELAVHGRVAALLELGSGFNPEFTGRENVYMYATVLGLSREEVEEQYQNIIDFADIGDFIDQPVKTYSSGMMVRLAFAVVAHVSADVLIIDEALAVGDAFFQQKCMRFIRKFKEEHTILFVSHDTGAVVNLCDRAVLLEKGMVKMIDSPKNVSEQYLKDFYANSQEVESSEETPEEETKKEIPDDRYDIRRDLINHSRFRNDIEVFNFKSGDSFGAGGAAIENVYFTDLENRPLSWVVGGEIVRLKIRARINQDMLRPIIGFTVKDHLGQWVLGDNTFITYQTTPVPVAAGQILEATFEFYMPTLRVGSYSIDCAIADGTQEEHVQHQWVHDAVAFVSHSAYGHSLYGVTMRHINLEVQ